MSDVNERKTAHVDAVLSGRVDYLAKTTGFEKIQFVHEALPELDLAQINLSTSFLGKQLSAPFLISSMTGGPTRSEKINTHLAVAAQTLGLAFAVGSQRVALMGEGAGGLGPGLRRHAPSIPIYANLGAVQLVSGFGLGELQRAIDTIEADALILHLNPLQEALQAGGNTDWRGVEAAIEKACKALDRPVIVKEVGFGISAATARRLANCGVAALDVAGAGGTSWAAVEAAVAPTAKLANLAETFRDWGLPTAEALSGVRGALPHLPLIGSGGIRTGLDAAKAIRLGANLVAQAAAVLGKAIEGPDSVIAHYETMIVALRLACFATGSKNLTQLRQAPLIDA